ncbi:MAG TPA: hypothetical protein VMX55_04345 [candidate division Zixibacteria bacterium]|nr:hypothetical protein [candidate division Zixibacteria bacterium]
MKELYLNCDSPCWSCPTYGRVRKISSFQDRNLNGAYYCEKCDTYSLCKMGIAHRRSRLNKLVEVCTKCGHQLEKITLSYDFGQNEKPFTEQSIIVVRIPNGNKYRILKTLKASYFEDLAEILLYILTEIGTGYINLVEYNSLTQNYKSIFTDFLEPNKICLKNIPEEKLDQFIQNDL